MKRTFTAGFLNAKRALVVTIILSLTLTVSVFIHYDMYLRSSLRTPTQADQGYATRIEKQIGKQWSTDNDNLGQMDYSYEQVHRPKSYSSQRSFCRVHGGQELTPSMFKTFLYSDKYRTLYCSVPKVACTNWARVFLILSGNMNTTNPMDIASRDVHRKYGKNLSKLSSLTVDEIKFRLDNYYKFVFTRDPFERILSAYLNKFKDYNPYFHSRYGRAIAQRFRIKSAQTSFNGSDVTFREYVQYLTDFTRTKSFNGHWERMVQFCHPCLVKYDFIGSMNSMTADSDRVLEKIGASEFVKFPKRSAFYVKPTTQTYLREYYSQVPPALLDQFLEVYYPDFLMFNLTIPKSLRNLNRWKIRS